MNKIIISQITKELKITEKQVISVLNLLEEGNTVPFIARYRKEATGSLDEDQIRVVEKEYAYQAGLAKRKEEVIRLIDERGMLTPELEKDINAAIKLQQVEDIYLPFKEKRKTKATEAIKNGLEPLAQFIESFPKEEGSIKAEAKKFINENVKDVDAAIEGAGFIIAERISDTAKYREFIRDYSFKNGVIETKAKKKAIELDEKKKYEMYYDFSQVVMKVPSYRVLAFNRGEKEKVLSVNLEVNIDAIIEFISSKEIKEQNSDSFKYFDSIIFQK